MTKAEKKYIIKVIAEVILEEGINKYNNPFSKLQGKEKEIKSYLEDLVTN